MSNHQTNGQFGRSTNPYPSAPPTAYCYENGGNYYGQSQQPGYYNNAYRQSPHLQYRPPQQYVPPEHPAQKKRRKWLYVYYALRQASLIIAFVLIMLNINIYVSRRGRYLNDETEAVDPVYYSMWLTIPLSGVIAIWAVIGLLCIRKSPHRGGVPYQAQFGVELLFALGATVCFVLLVINICDKQASEEYEYPYLRYEVPLAALLGMLTVVQVGLVARAVFELNVDRKRRESDSDFEHV